MKHGTIRAVTLKTVIPLIMENLKSSENKAIKKFYESHVGEYYTDDRTGLYGRSALYIASLFFEEYSKKTDRALPQIKR
ncbi:MAG: hypothetical protein LBI42_06205 [Chitinispirillales bacterium]|jgi:hypothetical protein|nr:hypothetical protein [Chitinispirillales bacterium]